MVRIWHPQRSNSKYFILSLLYHLHKLLCKLSLWWKNLYIYLNIKYAFETSFMCFINYSAPWGL